MTDKVSQYPEIGKLSADQIRMAQALVEAVFEPKEDNRKRINICDVCEKVGIDRRNYYNWRTMPEFNKYRSWLVKQISSERLSEVVDAVAREAVAGSAPHAKIYLEYQREIKSELNVNMYPGQSPSGEQVNTLKDLKEKSQKEQEN